MSGRDLDQAALRLFNAWAGTDYKSWGETGFLHEIHKRDWIAVASCASEMWAEK